MSSTEVSSARRTGEVVDRSSGGRREARGASPNCRSRSMSATWRPRCARDTERFVEVSVLPVSGLLRPEDADEARLVGGAADRVPALLSASILCTSNRTCSGAAGSMTMSSAPASNARLRKPFGDPCPRTITFRSGACWATASRSSRRGPSNRRRRRGAGRRDGRAATPGPFRLDHSRDVEVRVCGQRVLHVAGVDPGLDDEECCDRAARHQALRPISAPSQGQPSPASLASRRSPDGGRSRTACCQPHRRSLPRPSSRHEERGCHRHWAGHARNREHLDVLAEELDDRLAVAAPEGDVEIDRVSGPAAATGCRERCRSRPRARCPGDLRVHRSRVGGGEVGGRTAGPGRCPPRAARPLRYEGSAIAPTSTSLRGSVVGAYIDWLATIVPGVPLGMSCFATSTGVGAFSPPTRAR